jgi:hypothetical protein
VGTSRRLDAVCLVSTSVCVWSAQVGKWIDRELAGVDPRCALLWMATTVLAARGDHTLHGAFVGQLHSPQTVPLAPATWRVPSPERSVSAAPPDLCGPDRPQTRGTCSVCDCFSSSAQLIRKQSRKTWCDGVADIHCAVLGRHMSHSR